MGDAPAQPPNPRAEEKDNSCCWLADTPGCGYRPSCKERGEVRLVAAIKRRCSRENCRKESGQNHAEDSMCITGALQEGRERSGRASEKDRPMAQQERPCPVVSQGAVQSKDAHMP